VRPSYVLGGRAMEIVHEQRELERYMREAVKVSNDSPVLLDRFLNDAIEVDVDAVSDGERVVIGGIMEHIEQAGVHSGDSACTLPPWSLPKPMVDRVRQIGQILARDLRVNGLMNVQLAIKGDRISILEVNPRASRTVPFVGKATHTAWARSAAMVMMGKTLRELGAKEPVHRGVYAVKESVFVFSKFPGVDIVLGPEMKSTGEVMGIDLSADIAFAKGQIASGTVLPLKGNVFISVRTGDRATLLPLAKELASMGFGIFASSGSAAYFREHGVEATPVQKIADQVRPNIIDLMSDGKVQLILNTPTRSGRLTDEGKIRAASIRFGVPIFTTTTGAAAAVRAIKALRNGDWKVAALQDYLDYNNGKTDSVERATVGV